MLHQDRIRQLHRDLLRQLRALYNTPRLVDMLVLGLASKNNRTRVEAAEAIGEIMKDEGVLVADKAKHKPLPALAQVKYASPFVVLWHLCLSHWHVASYF